MRNKHKFGPNGHDQETFDKFCDVASGLEAYELLYIIVERWCDNKDLEGIIGAIEENHESDDELYEQFLNINEI